MKDEGEFALDPNYPDDCHCWCCGIPESRDGIRYIEINEYRFRGRFRRWMCASCVTRLLTEGCLGLDEAGYPATFKFEHRVGRELIAKTLQDMLREIADANQTETD